MKRLGCLPKYCRVSTVTLIYVMRLHYFTPAVPQCYCVGVHNGHGFGSLFAKLFSKVATKTATTAARVAAKSAAKAAAKAAVKVARTAGKKAVKVVTTKGADLAKQVAKEALNTAAEVGGEFALQKINSAAEAVSSKLPPELVHSIANVAKTGVKTVGSSAREAAIRKTEQLIDKGVARAVGGLKRKAPAHRQPKKKKKRELLSNIIDRA